MKRGLPRLLCLVLILTLPAGCGRSAAPSGPGTSSPAASTAARPEGGGPESSGQSFFMEDANSLPAAESSAQEGQPEGDYMAEIEIMIGQTTFTAELYQNDAAQALAAMLPLTLKMSELNGNEKYFYLPQAPPKDPAVPDGIRTGDVMLYGSDCLVLFYQDFSTSYSYTPLGHITNPEGLAAALGGGSIQVSFNHFAGRFAPAGS